MKNAPRQYRNQRLGRAKPRTQQVLEVSIRREKEQVRRVRSAISSIAWLILFGALCAGAWVGTREGMRRLVWENPAFFLNDIRVKTDGTLTREQIIQSAGVVEGSNIWLLDEDKLRAALLALPQVDRAEVNRSIPHRVDIEIWERRPIAWLTEEAGIDPTASDRAYLIDRRGWVMKPRKNQDYMPLPIISGVEVGNLVLGKKANTLQINAALELLRQNTGNTHWQIKSIDVKKKYCLVVTDRNHAEITFGLDDIDKQLSKLNRLLEHLEPQQREIQTVNLLVKYNTPVTFFDEEPEVIPGRLDPKKSADAKAKPGEPKPAPVKATPPPRAPEPPKKASTPSKSSKGSLRKPFRLNE